MTFPNPNAENELELPDQPIVDSHVHLWNVERIRYPWLAQVPLLNRTYSLPDLQEAVAKTPVTGMVFVQGDATPEDCELEVAWVQQLARQDERLQGCIAWAPLEYGAEVRPYLERLAAHPLVRGVRRILQSESDSEFCMRPKFIEGVRSLKDFGWSFDLCINYRQMHSAIRFAEQVTGVPIVLDHIGKPDIKSRRFEPWATQVRLLGSFPHVHCKISGLVTEADHRHWTPGELRPFIDSAMEAFGFDRVMFGGDWPVATQAIRYPHWIALLQNVLRGVDESDRRKFWSLNATRIYRLSGFTPGVPEGRA
jgi:L-fuconolactonase